MPDVEGQVRQQQRAARPVQEDHLLEARGAPHEVLVELRAEERRRLVSELFVETWGSPLRGEPGGSEGAGVRKGARPVGQVEVVELVGCHQRGDRAPLLDLAEELLVAGPGRVDEEPAVGEAHEGGARSQVEPAHHQRVVDHEEIAGELPQR